MTRPRLGVAEVVARYGSDFFRSYSLPGHRIRALEQIARCRTAALGGRKRICARCEQTVVMYNSCRTRSCPRCGGGRRLRRVAAQQNKLLPATYFHVVFTLPGQLAPLALQNQRLLYSMLMRAAAETLKELAADPKHLGAEIGALTVLHTWGQALQHHPHVHCLVPGGGLRTDGRWRASRRDFLFPVRVMRALFRGKLLAWLGSAYARGELELHGRLEPLRESQAFFRLLRPLRKLKWVVYAKRPAAGAEIVLKYLARYVGRVAIADSRVLRVAEGRVLFRWTDRRDGGRKTTSLEAGEFLRRFSQHILPRGFVRIRHVGLLSSRGNAKLRLCRTLLRMQPEPPALDAPQPTPTVLREVCEQCGAPVYTVRFGPPVECPSTAEWWDTS